MLNITVPEVFFVTLRDKLLKASDLRFNWSYFTLILLCLPLLGTAQGYHMEEGVKSQKINFQLINNLIVIPLEVNGAKLSFILDSGVSKPILFNLSDQDSIKLNNVTEITIHGLGEGKPIKALSSKGNRFRLKKMQNNNQRLYVVMDRSMNFSPSLGITIHGIIGYDLFRDFVVDINYSNKVIRFYDPEHYTPRVNKKNRSLPLTIINSKSYVDGEIHLNERKNVGVKLLIDTGSSDAVWLFQDEEKGIGIPENNYDDFLGKGLNGNIFGKRTKINSITIADFNLKDAKAAFPNMESFNAIKDLGDRNGSIGGEILRRFNIVFNYPKNTITLKKNGFFNAPFQYNMSGIELQHNGLRYIAERIADPRGVVKSEEKSFGDVQILMQNRTRLSLVPEIIVSGIRAGSPAEAAGLREGDVILAVNGRQVHQYKLQEVMKMLNEKEGKRIRLLIERYNKDLLFSFVLKNLFK